MSTSTDMAALGPDRRIHSLRKSITTSGEVSESFLNPIRTKAQRAGWERVSCRHLKQTRDNVKIHPVDRFLSELNLRDIGLPGTTELKIRSRSLEGECIGERWDS